MALARSEEVEGLGLAQLLQTLLRVTLIHAIPEAEKWVVTLAGGEITSIKAPGLCVIWPWEEIAAIVPTDVFEVNPGGVEFDMLRRQPPPGEEGERILASVDCVGFARVVNARWVFLKFRRLVDPTTRRLSTERIAQMIMELVVSVVKDFVLKHDYEQLVESPDRRGFNVNDLRDRMNETFGGFGIVFEQFRISDPGATGEFLEVLGTAAAMRERARAQLIDAQADLEAARVHAQATRARLDALLAWAIEAAGQKGLDPQTRSQIIQMAAYLESTSEERGPDAPRPMAIFGMGGNGSADPTSAFVLSEIRNLGEQLDKLAESLNRLAEG